MLETVIARSDEGDGCQTPAVRNRADRIRRASRRGVYGRRNTRASGERPNVIRPVGLVVVDNVARSQLRDRLATLRACCRDYLRSAERPERDQETASHATGTVDEEPIAGIDLQRLVENLRGGERRHRKHGRNLPRDTRGLGGEQRSRSNQRWRPGPLVSQRERMGHDLVARCPVGDGAAHRFDQTGDFNAERHRRTAANIPAAGPDDLIPVAHAGRPNPDQYLVLGERTWASHFVRSNLGAGAADPRYEHRGRLNRFDGAAHGKAGAPGTGTA